MNLKCKEKQESGSPKTARFLLFNTDSAKLKKIIGIKNKKKRAKEESLCHHYRGSGMKL